MSEVITKTVRLTGMRIEILELRCEEGKSRVAERRYAGV